MSAILMVDEKPRLYSKQPRTPADVVAPEHIEIHADLERWGAWNRERYQPGTCASMEKLYYKGGDTTPPATAPTLVNPRHLQVERAVILTGVHSPNHGECIRHFYIRRSTAFVICRVLAIHWEDFPRWTYDARAMVLSIINADNAAAL